MEIDEHGNIRMLTPHHLLDESKVDASIPMSLLHGDKYEG